MIQEKQSVDFTRTQLAMIESALETQEKILMVQNRAGASPSTRIKLSELKAVKRVLQRTNRPRKPGIIFRLRMVFCGVWCRTA